MQHNGTSKLNTTAPLWVQPLRWATYLSIACYYRVAYRIRNWGRLPRRRGPSLLVINHQHDIESAVVVATLGLTSFSWRYPIFTVSSRRMWEPGFFAQRIAWARFALRGLNFGWLFSSIGMQPIENELHAKALASLAYMLQMLYGDLPLATVFRAHALGRIGPEFKMLSDVSRSPHLPAAQMKASLSDLNEPYRSKTLAATRSQLDADIAHFEELIQDGATIFLAPEAFYTGDGKMQRLRGILPKLAPFSQIFACGISFDPFVGRRLSMLFRVTSAAIGVPLDVQLKRLRPVTTSALLATWLHTEPGPFTSHEAVDAVMRQLNDVPPQLFIDPELRRRPETLVRSALRGLVRLATLKAEGNRFALTGQRTHPQFPQTSDIIAYQYNFHTETLAGAQFAQSQQSA
ncbi:MAG TPA: hypothetical protein VN860_06295 [Candidatus Acidoferrales bacterium]|nr:hypothetical protein [Candidatus Acidoferrales bacterium]